MFSIVFMDEIDAVGTKRYDSNSGGEREIQRTMLELLNQLDGFDSRGDVKVMIFLSQVLRQYTGLGRLSLVEHVLNWLSKFELPSKTGFSHLVRR